MTVTRCDRCGVVYNAYTSDIENKSSVVIIRENASYACQSRTSYDLCPACTKALKEWVDGGNKEEHE